MNAPGDTWFAHGVQQEQLFARSLHMIIWNAGKVYTMYERNQKDLPTLPSKFIRNGLAVRRGTRRQLPHALENHLLSEFGG
jgi:hypothetical protein